MGTKNCRFCYEGTDRSVGFVCEAHAKDSSQLDEASLIVLDLNKNLRERDLEVEQLKKQIERLKEQLRPYIQQERKGRLL